METIGPYKILDRLKGGRRPLYVVAGRDGVRLVVKTAPLADLNPEERERFERETAICATLDHPNLVRVVESGQTADLLYQVMEHLEGSDFSNVFASGRAFTWGEKLAMMDGVCEGLAYAHARGLVHRDIKPANLFLENSGRVRILDFGMVRMDSSALTRAGAAVGTLNYMAPEQIRGEKCTAASDVFAAGIVFYQLCAGRHPFAGPKKSLPEILSAILFEAPPEWSAAGAPEGMEFVVCRALDKDASKRWRNASELRQALTLCRFTLENRPAVESAPAVSSPGPQPDPEKTVVVRRPAAAPGPATPRPAEPPPPAAPPKPVPKPETRFCPSCTAANALDAVVCARCGVPLVAPAAPAPAAVAPQSAKLMWMLIGAGALLVIVVVLAIVSR